MTPVLHYGALRLVPLQPMGPEAVLFRIWRRGASGRWIEGALDVVIRGSEQFAAFVMKFRREAETDLAREARWN